ncbi:MAG: AraC family transcriptional regulator [Niastella sp.]|nr:AraC family transcriptional regulator [Niastella sp.]
MKDWQTGILFVAAVQGLLLSLALMGPGKNKHASRYFLGLVLLVFAIELLNDWGIQIGYHQLKNAFPFWVIGSYLLIPPSCYYFIRSNIDPTYKFSKKDLLYYTPAAIEIVAEFAQYLYNCFSTQQANLMHITAWWFFTEICPVLWLIGVLLWGGQQLRQLARSNASPVSFTGLHPAKLLSVFILLSLLTLLWVADAVLQLPVFPAVELVLILLLFTLSYLSYTQGAFFDVVVRATKSRLSVSPIFGAYNDTLELTKLQGAFEQKGLYRKPKLTLEELAGELDLPVRYVSYLINTYHAANFHQYINTWRVQEVIRKINDPGERHKTLLALALESGFSSKSSFNQVFKDHTGKSPSQYFS